MKEFYILSCDKDYSTDKLNIHFEGQFNPHKMFEYICDNYPKYKKTYTIEDFIPETEFRGLQNVGSLTLKLS